MVELRGIKTRQEVAKDLDITPQMLGMLERGDRTPSLELAKRISDYYNVDIEGIFFNQNGNKSCPKVEKEVI